MNNRNEYHSAIADKRAELAKQFPSGDCLVTSLPNTTLKLKPDVTCAVTIENAARLLVENTHRLATPEEIEAFKAQQTVLQSANAPGMSAVAEARRRFEVLQQAGQQKGRG